MYRALLLISLANLAIFASCGIIINYVDSLLGSVDEDDLEFSGEKETAVRPRGPYECTVKRRHYMVTATKKVSWIGADTLCRQQKMELVSIGNADEYQIILDTIIPLQNFSLKGNGIWTSGYYDSEEGKYRWKTRDTPMNYTVWQSGRPGTSDNRDKCVELRKYDQYKMNDVSCLAENYVACQKIEQSHNC